MVSRERWVTIDAAEDLSWLLLFYAGAAAAVGQAPGEGRSGGRRVGGCQGVEGWGDVCVCVRECVCVHARARVCVRATSLQPSVSSR